MKSLLFALFWCTNLPLIIIGQNDKPLVPEYAIKYSKAPITLDGKDDDPGWQSISYTSPFWEYAPLDTGYCTYTTQFKMSFDKNYLYLFVKCQSTGNDFVTPSLRRDFRAGGNDNLTFLIDPTGDRINAYSFGVNPFGVTREGLISNGGNDTKDFTTSWDNKWRAKCQIHDTYWTAELAIPFKTLRYRKENRIWRMNCYRFDTQTRSSMTWSHIPRNQRIFGLAFLGSVNFEQDLPDPGTNISLIPYASVSKDVDPLTQNHTSSSANIGGDLKVGLTPSLNLDLTVNPDFSQVEVDEQVTNLTRFEVSFPETRQFFLENADLFSSYGNENIRPFFSRRIGISFDTLTRTNVLNTILGGARLSGKLTPNLRTGLLHMTTAGDKTNGLPSYHYSILSLQQKMYSRSNVSFQFINKQTFDSKYATDLYDKHNRVAAVEYNMASSNNEWTGKVFYQRSFSALAKDQPFAFGTQIALLKKKYRILWDHEQVGKGYDAQVGFIPRTDYTRIKPNIGLVYLPTHGWFTSHGPYIETDLIWSPGYGKTDHSFSLGWEGQLRSASRFEATLSHNYTYLFKDFTPSGVGKALLKNTDYRYVNFKGSIGTDRRKAISSILEIQAGQFYNGSILSLTSMFMMRHQPYLALTGTINYNKIQIPAPYSSNEIWLIGPRIDLTATRNFFLTGFFQYNSLAENVNINARLQWRYAQVSDFYIVYTDNYYPDQWNLKNRSIVAKLTYWLNM